MHDFCAYMAAVGFFERFNNFAQSRLFFADKQSATVKNSIQIGISQTMEI